MAESADSLGRSQRGPEKSLLPTPTTRILMSKDHMLRQVSALTVLLFVFAPSFASAQKAKAIPTADQDPDKYFENFPYGKKILSAQDQDALRSQENGDLGGGYAEYARAIIFGRHGRVFVTKEISDVLSTKKWYKPNPHFSNSMLNADERANLDIVRGIEADKHDNVVPGDLRFWKDKDIPKGKLVDANLFDLHIMHAEIEAIHGKTFSGEPLVQKYFEARYWYKPAAKYNPKDLNAHERANLALLAEREKGKEGAALTPGSLIAFGEKPITPALLKGLNLYNLRLLRNEIYAIRGGSFHTQWIQNYFNDE